MFLLLLLFATRLEYHRINANNVMVTEIWCRKNLIHDWFLFRHSVFCVVAGLHGRRPVIRG